MPLSFRAFSALLLVAASIGACDSPSPIVVVATNTPAPTPTATPVPSPTPIPYRDTITIGLSVEPRTLQPLIADESPAQHILDAIYEPYITTIDFAYQANPNGGLLADVPALDNGGATLDDGGTPNDPIDDQLTLTFHMLPGPAWCDGAPVTAADSVYAFELARDPDSGVASRIALDRVASYRALDDYTLEVKLKPGELDPSYPAYFWMPLPAHLWRGKSALELQTASESSRSLCGYGPYTIAQAEDQGAGWIAGESITLVANPHYFRGQPRTKRLVFKFVSDPDRRLAEVLSGKLDVATRDGLSALRLPQYAEFARSGVIALTATRAAVWEYLIFNLYAPTNFDSVERVDPHPILSDVRVRQAIAYAIDRQDILDQIYAGYSAALNEPLMYPNHPLYTSETQISTYPFDPERARSLLDEAGWRDTDGDDVRECDGCASGAEAGARLALTYRTTHSALRDPVVERVRSDLAAVGFEITVEFQPADVLFGDATGLIVGDFEIGQLSELAEIDPGGERRYGCDWIPAPDNGWYGENYSGWCNDAADRALLDATHALRVDARRAAYADFQREVTRDLPGLPLFPRIEVTLANPRLENLKPNDSMASITWNAFELAMPNP